MRDQSPDKIKIEETIFHKVRYDRQFQWQDIKHIAFEDEDEIRIEYNEGWHDENNGMDAHFVCSITRMVEETDEEFAERQRQLKRDEDWARDRRYQSYLKLKKEFENDNI